MYWRVKMFVRDAETVEIREVVISHTLVKYKSRNFKFYNRR